MRSLAVFVALLALSTCAFGSGWVGQQLVNRPNGDTFDGNPAAAVDRYGRPWVVWDENYGDSVLLWSRWTGVDWEPQRGVSANAPGVQYRFRPDLAFDERGRAWVVWNNVYANNNNDIAACYWSDSQWSAEQHVSPPESTDLYFAPKVSCGGGQTWCVWYGGPSDVLPYSVYASRWESLTSSWAPETRVSPLDSNHHWWCDVAVDSLGIPHVVWCTHPLYTVLYSYFDGQQWVAPIPVNDTTQFTASPWASPRIVIDRTGVMHLCFTGAKAGAQHRDIVYTQNDGSGWMPCQMVTHDSLYDEWYSDIAADRPENVSVAWDRQNEGPDQFRVYAAHLEDGLWSTEQRLDDTTSHDDCVPAVCLDSLGCPWVFWNGIPYEAGQNDDVFFNRFDGTGITEAQPMLGSCVARFRCTSPQSCTDPTVAFELTAARRVRLALYDEAGRCKAVLADGYAPKGTHAVRGPSSITPGAYFFCLQVGGQSEVCKVVLLGH